ncbi:MAG: MBL fold metallo-hydrolase [Limisphaerales bacterium]
MGTRLTFHGAAGDVTGSCYLLETDHARILIDCGMFQGGRKKDEMNVLPQGLDVSRLNAVLVTHAHVDHTGRLPLLAKHGYRGPVFATAGTIELASLVLRDSVFVQSQDIARFNRKRMKRGESPLDQPYNEEDVESLLRLLQEVDYEKFHTVAPGIQAKYLGAGHILGSASIQLLINDAGRSRRIVFSGDIGPGGVPMLKDPECFQQAEVVVMESTYGDRDHKPLQATEDEFEAVVKEAVRQGTKILVPVFAIGRTQLMLYLLAEMFCDGTVEEFPVYIDSPMGIEATKIYRNHINRFDEEFQQLRRCRPVLEACKSFTPTPTPQDSMALNDEKGPCFIMAGAGMCTGGRILHHLRENLPKPGTSIIFVGFQAYGSIGRRLVDGADEIKIFGDQIPVNATVHTLGGFSAHAGQTQLMNWFKPLARNKPRVILTHGEDRGRDPLARLIEKRHGLKADRPIQGDTITL